MLEGIPSRCALLWIKWWFEWVIRVQLCFLHTAIWLTAAVLFFLEAFVLLALTLCFFGGREGTFFCSEVTFGRPPHHTPPPFNGPVYDDAWEQAWSAEGLGLRLKGEGNENSRLEAPGGRAKRKHVCVWRWCHRQLTRSCYQKSWQAQRCPFITSLFLLSLMTPDRLLNSVGGYWMNISLYNSLLLKLIPV